MHVKVFFFSFLILISQKLHEGWISCSRGVGCTQWTTDFEVFDDESNIWSQNWWHSVNAAFVDL